MHRARTVVVAHLEFRCTEDQMVSLNLSVTCLLRGVHLRGTSQYGSFLFLFPESLPSEVLCRGSATRSAIPQ